MKYYKGNLEVNINLCDTHGQIMIFFSDLLYSHKKIDEVAVEFAIFHFYRAYVAKNQPCVIRNGIKHWPAVAKWDRDYFRLLFEYLRLVRFILLHN